MRVAEIMTANVLTVRPGTPAVNAQARMRSKGIHHLLVQEGETQLGIVSTRDLGRAARRVHEPTRLTVSDFMTPHVVTVKPDTSVRRAANIMRGHSIGCLIVAAEGKAVGIVTVADLLDRVGNRLRRRPARHASGGLHYKVPHRKQHGSGHAW